MDGTAKYAFHGGYLATPACVETTVSFPLCKDPISYLTGCNIGYCRMPYRMSNDAISGILGFHLGYRRMPSLISHDAILGISGCHRVI